MAKTDFDHLGKLVLDTVMNDPKLQEPMNSWVKKELKRLGHDPDVAGDETKENTAEYNLYYSLCDEYHAKVFSHAILNLRHESNED